MPNASEPVPTDRRGAKAKSPPPRFGVEVLSGSCAVREALGQVREELHRFELDQEEEGTVQLVLAEVLNNIVEHAYPPSDPVGPITIEALQRPDGLHLSIRDKGHAMPDGQLPIGALPPVDVDLPDLPEGGFGWFLIRDLARDISYRRDAQENHLRLRIAVGVGHTGKRTHS